jgi:hypothetical protein
MNGVAVFAGRRFKANVRVMCAGEELARIYTVA